MRQCTVSTATERATPNRSFWVLMWENGALTRGKLRTGMRLPLALSVLLLTRTGSAGEMHVPMGGHAGYDAAFVATTTAGILVGSYVLHPNQGDRAPLDGLGHRPSNKALARAGDVLLVVGLSAGAGFSALADRGVPGADRYRGPVITLEGALAAAMLTQLTKNLFGVCRPRDWDDLSRTCAATDEAHRSFPSGHTAPLAGMAGAALGLALLPTSPRGVDLAVAIGCTTTALGVAVLRERAGAHSLVDTAVAFVGGGLVGLATAALHLGPSTTPSTTSAPLLSFGSAF